MRQNPHVRICGGPGSATTLVYPTLQSRGVLIVRGHAGVPDQADSGLPPTNCQNETVAVIEMVRGAPSHAAFSVMAER